MKKRLVLFLASLPLLYFSQKNTLTTEEAYYPVLSSSKYEKTISKSNAESIFFEFDTKKTTTVNQDCHLEESEEYLLASIINSKETDEGFTLQDGSLLIIQEAQNKSGEWIPIEHWIYSDCGNSYDNKLILSPKMYATFPVKIQKGDVTTKIRLKMKDPRTKKIYFSKSFDGKVNSAQFKNPEWKKSDKDYSYYISHFDEKL